MSTPEQAEQESVPPQPSRWRRIVRSPWTHLVAAFVVLALIQGFVVKLYQVPSSSMEPTLQVSDRILVNRLAYVGSEPEIGQTVVFNRPSAWGEDSLRGPLRTAIGWIGDLIGIGPSNSHALVKRIVAGPGQTVSCCSTDGALIVDGEEQPLPDPAYDLPYEAGVLDCETAPASTRCFREFTVPEGQYLVLGDHRSNSDDSLGRCRSDGVPDIADCVKLVPRDAIVGTASFVIWPLNRLGPVPQLGD
ncbi:MAG: signal peptidase I [Leucobacter sp.]